MDGKAFIKAVKFITEEKGISEDVVFEGMEQALITAYKKNFKKQTNVKMDFFGFGLHQRSGCGHLHKATPLQERVHLLRCRKL